MCCLTIQSASGHEGLQGNDAQCGAGHGALHGKVATSCPCCRVKVTALKQAHVLRTNVHIVVFVCVPVNETSGSGSSVKAAGLNQALVTCA